MAVGVNSNNQLVITSGTYGSQSQVTIGSGSALSVLGFSGTETDSGTNVAGNFVVNGVSEAATGNGQVLTGNSGNANTAGLEILVSLTPSQIQASPEATVTVTNGIASQLSTLLNNLTDPVTGRITSIDNQYQTQIQSLQQQITKQNASIALQQQTLTAEFTNMEETLAQLQETGNFLSAQLNAASLFNGESTSVNTPSASSLNVGGNSSSGSSTSSSGTSGTSSTTSG